ncbi:MAG TPA: hypothetical protein P5132_09400, partial [Bacteroidales bacterium]|nr:hypothetical protein [Bacteroidales bacterium]
MKILNLTLLLSVIFSISINSQAQEPLKHIKKIYRSPEGKLYANKSLPIYFRIATSPDDDAQSFLLNPAEDSKKYANPMYFDTEGYNTFRSPSKVDTVTKQVVYPLEDIIYEIYSDSKAPVTRFSIEQSKHYLKDGIYYFNEKITIQFNAKDETSGVEASYYSLNGQAFQALTSTIELNEEKQYILKYYSVDNVGNAEDIKEIKIVIDITKPETKLTAEPDKYENIVSPRTKIILEATDNSSLVKQTLYSIDNGTFYKYSKPLNLATFKEGEHNIIYYSIDNVGNEEPKKEFQFYLDKTAPMVVDELIGNTFITNGKEYSSGRSKIKLTAMDNKSGVKEIRYSISDGEFQVYSQPFYLSKSGQLKIQTFVIDNVNNQSINTIMTDKSNISYVDLSGPKLGHSFTGAKFQSKDTVFITKDTKIQLAASDDAAGFNRLTYSIDNGDITPYTKPFIINNEGVHTITYTGYDNVENTSVNSFICVEDNIGPEIFFRFSILSDKQKTLDGKIYDIYPEHVVLFLSSTDLSVGFDKMFYSVNGQAKKPYTSLITGFQGGKAYQVKVT